MGVVPRGVKQIKNLRQNSQTVNPQRTTIHEKLMALMTGEASSSNKYLRRIITDSDNFCVVLFTDDMIDFILKRCISQQGNSPVSPIHVDTTYRLTNMWALVCTMRATDFVGEPLVVGPILLTKRQRSRDFQALWDQLISCEKSLQTSRLLFITDGDDALVQSISNCFPYSKLFRCRLHLYGNVERKLKDYNIPATRIMFDVKNMFKYHSSDYHQKLCQVYQDWSTYAKSNGYSSNSIDGFLRYFRRSVEPVIHANLDEQVELAGLCSNVSNNPAESTNAMLKRWCKGSHDIDVVCLDLKEGVMALFAELDKGFRGISQKFISEAGQEPSQKRGNLFAMLDERDEEQGFALSDTTPNAHEVEHACSSEICASNLLNDHHNSAVPPQLNTVQRCSPSPSDQLESCEDDNYEYRYSQQHEEQVQHSQRSESTASIEVSSATENLL